MFLQTPTKCSSELTREHKQHALSIGSESDLFSNSDNISNSVKIMSWLWRIKSTAAVCYNVLGKNSTVLKLSHRSLLLFTFSAVLAVLSGD